MVLNDQTLAIFTMKKINQKYHTKLHEITGS